MNIKKCYKHIYYIVELGDRILHINLKSIYVQ